MNIEEAINTLADGDELRLMTRHNAADFVEATAKVVKAARLVANGNQGTLIRSEWNVGHRIWTLRMDADVDLASHQSVIVAAVES